MFFSPCLSYYATDSWIASQNTKRHAPPALHLLPLHRLQLLPDGPMWHCQHWAFADGVPKRKLIVAAAYWCQQAVEAAAWHHDQIETGRLREGELIPFSWRFVSSFGHFLQKGKMERFGKMFVFFGGRFPPHQLLIHRLMCWQKYLKVVSPFCCSANWVPLPEAQRNWCFDEFNDHQNLIKHVCLGTFSKTCATCFFWTGVNTQ